MCDRSRAALALANPTTFPTLRLLPPHPNFPGCPDSHKWIILGSYSQLLITFVRRLGGSAVRSNRGRVPPRSASNEEPHNNVGAWVLGEFDHCNPQSTLVCSLTNACHYYRLNGMWLQHILSDTEHACTRLQVLFLQRELPSVPSGYCE